MHFHSFSHIHILSVFGILDIYFYVVCGWLSWLTWFQH